MQTAVKMCFFALLLLVPQKQVKSQEHAVLQQDELLLWDDKPAKEWMKDAYPIGNGRMGGMIFGGVTNERIQFNELSLWTGDEQETGSYQAFGDVLLNFDREEPVTAYKRELNMNNAVQSVSYTMGGVHFKREYFCSFPDKVIVMRFTADQNAAHSLLIRLIDAHQGKVTAKGNQLFVNGQLENGLQYSSSLIVKGEGGSITVKEDDDGGFLLDLKSVDSFTVFLSAATDYSNNRQKEWRGETPGPIVNSSLQSASSKKYITLLNNHITDYQQLFSRVSLTFGNTASNVNALPTYQRLLAYKKAVDPQLEALIFHYGRYLLISSSRKGGLPANLQGIWNDSNTPPWRSDYHSNINIQMNYWLAEPTNLSECHFPYLDYINSMREVKKKNTQQQYPGVRGWTVKTENNIFGGESFSWNTPGSAWYMQALWEHYAFTHDTVYLRNFAYPIIKEVVEFWDDHLRRRDDGTLVAPMGWSPEHGPTEDGVSHDQQIVYDLFTNYVEAADALKIDQPYREHVLNMREHLLKPKIGSWGQLQEWETDRDDPEDKHRHASHLFGLHPGRQFSVVETPELASAAKVSLLARGDASTGWSMAWKINFWARLHDGEHAYKILHNFITLVGGDGVDYDEGGGIYSNLLCAHPPFQIDGNLGYSSGVAEMLVQSQTAEIELLPALPGAWANGAVKGLRARGNFEISEMIWKDGKIIKLSIKSLSGGKCVFSSPNTLQAAGSIAKERENERYVYEIDTQKGKTYDLTADN